MTQFRIFGTRSRWLWRFLAVICIAVPTELQAASVTVTGDDPRQTIRVTIEDATIDYVVADLRKKFGFDVSGLSNDNRGEPQTMTISGSLQRPRAAAAQLELHDCPLAQQHQRHC
jgi:hypothetical protein